MALNIRPSSTSSSPSTSTNQSSGPKSPATDLFAQGMATAAQMARKSSAAKTPQTRHTSSAPKPAAKPASPAKPKPAAHDSDDSQSKSAAAKSSSASSKPKASQTAQAAAKAPAHDAAANDAATSDAAAEANAGTNTTVNGAKGRAPAARAQAKNNAAQTAAAKASDATDDPTSADSTNEAGLSLIQLLAKSLASDDTDVPSTDAAAPAATDKTSTDGADATSDDPNAIALAMFSQSLAAALAQQQTLTGKAGSADPGDAAAAIGSATQSPGDPASMQNLMAVLAHDVAANANGNSDDGAAQFNVDPTKTDATNSGATDSSGITPNALAHLGVASHFAAQHLRNDTNTADLKSPVGTTGWQDEIGTHLTWMTQKGLETGSLRVSPEHLGPVEVNISVQNGDASVWFAANHPDTRAALEQALPRLREMFANQGMNLADSGVSRQNLSQQGSRNPSRSGASQAISAVSAVGSAEGGSVSAARINGIVDLYA